MVRLLRDFAKVLFGLLEMILIIRVLMKLFGANLEFTFVAWLYEVTQPLINPFLPAFPAPMVQGEFTLEFSALFALIIYAVVGYALGELLTLLDRRLLHSLK